MLANTGSSARLNPEEEVVDEMVNAGLDSCVVLFRICAAGQRVLSTVDNGNVPV